MRAGVLVLLTVTVSMLTAPGRAVSAASAEPQTPVVRARDLPASVKVAAALVAVYLLTVICRARHGRGGGGGDDEPLVRALPASGMQVDRVVHKGDDAELLPEALRTLAT